MAWGQDEVSKGTQKTPASTQLTLRQQAGSANIPTEVRPATPPATAGGTQPGLGENGNTSGKCPHPHQETRCIEPLISTKNLTQIISGSRTWLDPRELPAPQNSSGVQERRGANGGVFQASVLPTCDTYTDFLISSVPPSCSLPVLIS